MMPLTLVLRQKKASCELKKGGKKINHLLFMDDMRQMGYMGHDVPHMRYGAHHPKADVGRLYLQKCEGGRGLIGLKDCVEVEVHRLEKNLITSKEKILKEVSQGRILENNKYRRSKEEIHKEHQEKYEGIRLHGQFRKATEEVRSKCS